VIVFRNFQAVPFLLTELLIFWAMACGLCERSVGLLSCAYLRAFFDAPKKLVRHDSIEKELARCDFEFSAGSTVCLSVSVRSQMRKF
jgi:hypothetical protein